MLITAQQKLTTAEASTVTAEAAPAALSGARQFNNLVRHEEWLPAPLGKGVVPEDGGPRVGLLVAVDDYHHGERGGAHLVAELGVPDGELGPEEEGELLVHDGLGALLLRPLDLFQAHVAKGHGKLASGLKGGSIGI